MYKDILNARLQDNINMAFFKNGFTVDNHLITFDGNHLTSIFIYKILYP